MKRKWDWKNAAMGALLFGMGMALGLAAVIDLHERVQTQGFGGYLFSVAWLAVAAVLYPNSKTEGLAHVNYQPLFVVVSVLMAVSVAILYFTTNEPKLAAAEKDYEAAHPEQQLSRKRPTAARSCRRRSSAAC